VIAGPVRVAPQVLVRIAAGDLLPAPAASSASSGCCPCTRAYSSRHRSPAAVMSSSAASGGSRVASHAGSWYSSDPAALSAEFDLWLAAVGPLAIDPASTRVRAIISPSVGGAQRTWHTPQMQQATITHIRGDSSAREEEKDFCCSELAAEEVEGRVSQLRLGGSWMLYNLRHLWHSRSGGQLHPAVRAAVSATCCSSRSSLPSPVAGRSWAGVGGGRAGVWLSPCGTCRGHAAPR
jgi:hypothetical protein